MLTRWRSPIVLIGPLGPSGSDKDADVAPPPSQPRAWRLRYCTRDYVWFAPGTALRCVHALLGGRSRAMRRRQLRLQPGCLRRSSFSGQCLRRLGRSQHPCGAVVAHPYR